MKKTIEASINILTNINAFCYDKEVNKEFTRM